MCDQELISCEPVCAVADVGRRGLVWSRSCGAKSSPEYQLTASKCESTPMYVGYLMAGWMYVLGEPPFSGGASML